MPPSATSGREPAASSADVSGSLVLYEYSHARPSHSSACLWPVLRRLIASHPFAERRAFDLGCGNGATAKLLTELGFAVTGVDPSRSGIEQARKGCPGARFEVASTNADLAKEFGTFPLVVSFEVVSFVIDPPLFAKRVRDLLQPGGLAIISTPYHGYWKNLLLSLFNRWDAHLDPFWTGSLVRFFSTKTYRRLWREAGFEHIDIIRVGRLPWFAKSMIAVLKRAA
jgi:2-polyprenyl-3-methyl-5-hydroxy-6-metoxy-1,4-benzoquinol methylase